jgi:pyruvate/2-oxoglutarate dehydrogenase complex dihydrolipoamide acyltransferase (E2) component
MADIEFVLPKLGMSMVEGIVEEWHVAEGAAVAEGQEIVTISTDKVETELPSPASGTLAKIVAQVGDELDVGAVLAIIRS